MAVEQTWALQNTTINAVTFRQILQALTGPAGGVVPGTVSGSISNGKPVDLLVGQQSTPNMTVQVNPGQAVMPGTQLSTPTASYNWTAQGSYYALNDAATSVTIATADPVNPRIDVVYIAAQDSFYSGSNNQSLIGVVTGTAAPSPSAPAAPNNAVVLAQVNVAANATSIVTANITDQRPILSMMKTVARVGVAVSSTIATSTTTGSNQLWANFGTVTVPTWATQCAVTYSITAVISPSSLGNTRVAMQVGSATGNLQRLMETVSSGRFYHTYNDVITGLTPGTQNVNLVTLCAAGSAYQIDTNSSITAIYTFMP